MTLPEGFHWTRRWQYSKCHDALALYGEHVAVLLDKVGGGWFARLECQRPGVEAPLVTRPCSSYESGKKGCELWAERHQVRLRSEVRELIRNRPVHVGGGHFATPSSRLPSTSSDR
ncbi:hypothetical protein EA658_00005 [Pseudoxanthomonas winnipegensis]|uniref:Uncharacterized protein n=1 Tax=Pseudoxanthomonas winnipegensis TaxID=2480810 RepID=A0ABY1WH38_9GAMM|nr:hypothetical protein [Pseudoxanthomonas winnipegensis]TAA22029.1 hypothetical protein EA658_00005 [Pseudoxanthomonas winnipegensis]